MQASSLKIFTRTTDFICYDDYYAKRNACNNVHALFKLQVHNSIQSSLSAIYFKYFRVMVQGCE